MQNVSNMSQLGRKTCREAAEKYSVHAYIYDLNSMHICSFTLVRLSNNG